MGKEYRQFGCSGLRISPIILGTMKFGTGIGSLYSSTIISRYKELGGNFIDTADVYGDGESEIIIGNSIGPINRDYWVIGTKGSLSIDENNPNANGNGRKHIISSVEKSLKRLATDYIDVYWLHNWDTLTPYDEVLEVMNELIKQGKIRYFGLSNFPAWYFSSMNTSALEQRCSGPIGMQMQYSLYERNIENEHIHAIADNGCSIIAWGVFGKPYNFSNKIEESIKGVANSFGCFEHQTMLKWVLNRPCVDGAIVGPSTIKQLENSFEALDKFIDEDSLQFLTKESSYLIPYPYNFHIGDIGDRVRGKKVCENWIHSELEKS